MLKRALGVLAVAVGILPAIALAEAGGDSLARTLPTDKTVFYAELDVSSFLSEARALLDFTDPEAAGQIAFQVKELYGMVRELAAGHEFQPILFDKITDVKLYAVVMAMDEPKVKVHSYKVPRYDRETWEPIPGEFEERTHTETQNYILSFVMKTPDPECAADFMEEIKALAERESRDNGFERVDIEVERGELIGDQEESGTLGRLDEYVILSNGTPRELWAALMAPPARILSETPGYRRLVGGDEKPQAFMLANIEPLVRKAEESLKRGIEEAEREAAEREEAGEDEMRDWELQAARSSYKTFVLFNKLLSLDQCKQAGASVYFSASGDAVVRDFRGMFAHGENISPILEEILTGSGNYTLPAAAGLENMWVMGRINLKRIYDEVIEVLTAAEPQAAAQFAMAMQLMKAQAGVDLSDMFILLDSDVYAFVDIVEKEVERRRYEFDEETEEPKVVTEKEMAVVPEVTMLWGVRDAQATRAVLSTVFTRLSTNPSANQFVKKRTYQETDVFCVGMDVARDEKYPDGMTSFAMTIVDRYFTAGGWEHVTGLIRRMGSATEAVDTELAAIVEKHADANFLMVVPAAWQKKFERLMTKVQGEDRDPFERILEEIKSLDLELEDEAMAERIKAALGELVIALQAINEAGSAKLAETAVISGAHRGACSTRSGEGPKWPNRTGVTRPVHAAFGPRRRRSPRPVSGRKRRCLEMSAGWTTCLRPESARTPCTRIVGRALSRLSQRRCRALPDARARRRRWDASGQARALPA